MTLLLQRLKAKDAIWTADDTLVQVLLSRVDCEFILGVGSLCRGNAQQALLKGDQGVLAYSSSLCPDGINWYTDSRICMLRKEKIKYKSLLCRSNIVLLPSSSAPSFLHCNAVHSNASLLLAPRCMFTAVAISSFLIICITQNPLLCSYYWTLRLYRMQVAHSLSFSLRTLQSAYGFT
jgi:hypothetical protein